MAKYSSISPIIVICSLLSAIAGASAPDAIPALSNWENHPGTFFAPQDIQIVISDEIALVGLQNRTVKEEAEQLIRDLHEDKFDSKLAVGTEPGEGDIVLELDKSLDSEAYSLNISDSVVISASSSAGIYYGGRTLLQLLRSSRNITCGSTMESPGQNIRGGMLDAARKYWNVEYLKDLIREMGYQKLNMLNLHFADAEGFRLYSPAFPGLADPTYSYSREEISDLVSFAAAHHVEIMPGFEFPGHATVVSNHFGIGFGMGDNACTEDDMYSYLTPNWVVDMTISKSLNDVGSILKEFLPWFDSRYVHLGGDELPPVLSNCGRIKDYIANQGDVDSAGDMLVKFINSIAEIAAQQGKQSIIYNGFEAMSLSQQMLNKDIVIQDWQGDGTEKAFDGHKKIWMNSNYAYMTPNDYHNIRPNIDYLASTWEPRTTSDMLGSSFGVWADYNMWAQDEFFEEHMKELRSAMADRSWNVQTKTSKESLINRLSSIGSAPGVKVFSKPKKLGEMNPLHHYPFEPEPYPSGWTWAGSPGQTVYVQDITGNLSGSTYIVKNPKFVDNGFIGSALEFSDDGQGVGLGGVDLEAPWTMSMWFRQAFEYPGATLLSSRSENSIILNEGYSGNLALNTPTGVVQFNTGLTDGKWTAVSLINNGTSISLYLNGTLADNVESSIPLPLAAIGSPDKSFRGKLDELFVFDAALSQAEISARYYCDIGHNPNCSTLP